MPPAVLVLTRENVAPRLSRVLVAPATTVVRGLATEVALDESDGLTQSCVANLDNAQLLNVNRLLTRIGEIAPRRWPEVCRSMAAVLDC